MKSVTADEALERLKQGNERFQKGTGENPGRNVARRAELTEGQSPSAIILCCSDSRVAPEFAFDAGLGDLFVVRVAGNVANTSSIASIEYAVLHLGAKLVVVTGHESCGAVNAAIDSVQEGGDAEQNVDHLQNLDHLLGYIRPALETSDALEADLHARNHARLTAQQLCDDSEIIRNAVENDGVKIVPAFHQLASGAVVFD